MRKSVQFRFSSGKGQAGVRLVVIKRFEFYVRHQNKALGRLWPPNIRFLVLFSTTHLFIRLPKAYLLLVGTVYRTIALIRHSLATRRRLPRSHLSFSQA